jgi:hypothetical protein
MKFMVFVALLDLYLDKVVCVLTVLDPAPRLVVEGLVRVPGPLHVLLVVTLQPDHPVPGFGQKVSLIRFSSDGHLIGSGQYPYVSTIP